MRLDVKFSISLTRSKKEIHQDEDPPHVDEKVGATIERADPAPVGFAIFPPVPEERK